MPEELIGIRAYVRWEEAGMPEDTPPEWQAAEYAKARLDLQLEVLNGVTLNDIRRRYNQETVDGDDEPIFSRGDANVMLDDAAGKFTGATSNVVPMETRPTPLDDFAPTIDIPGGGEKQKVAIEPEEWIEPPPEQVGEYHSDAYVHRDLRSIVSHRAGGDEVAAPKYSAKTFMSRWASFDSPNTLVNQRLYTLGDDSEMLVQMYQDVAEDESASSGPRKRVVSRSVVITTDSQEDLVLHWGVAKDEPGQWLLPETTVWPGKTTAVSDMSVETPFVSGQGCLPAEAFDKDEVEPGEEDLCYPIQQLTIELPGEGADEIMGLQFVIRNKEGTSWFRDEKNGNSNFHANYATTQHSKAADELLETIIRSEAGNGWWTLMHRFNLASTMLEQKCAPGASEKSIAKAVAAAAKIYVWLRYSSNRKLTWQRNYNVKPRELSAAQSKLTKTIAKLFCDAPHLRDVTRLMLGTVGKGGEGGQGQQIRDEILNIMHRNDIKEKKGIWMEEWHQKLHNNTTPDDIIICEAYLAFLKSNMDISEYWRVLSEGGIDRARLESYERPILAEPTPRPTKKVALIKDFQNYLKILKSVHSGADLIECIKTANKGLGGVSPALNYARVAQNGGGDAIQLLAACVDARHELRGAGLANPSDQEWTRELLYLDLSLDDVARRAVERSGEANYGLEDQMRLAGLVMENLALSLPTSNEDIVLALIEWRRVEEARRGGDSQWALRAKAVVDRVRLAVALHADDVAAKMQPAATEIGVACGIEHWAVDLFAEEVIRGGPAFALSLVLSRLDPLLRAEADMGAWQIISPVPAVGYVKHVHSLREVMNETFTRPTVLVADKVGGDEEIPAGSVAVLTTCSVDVLSHSAVRARNMGCLFATCYDEAVLDSLAALDGEPVSASVMGGDEVVWEEVDASAVALGAGAGDVSSVPKGLKLAKIPFCGKFTVPLQEFKKGVVGAKAINTLALNESLGGGKIPAWINLPKSMVIPFGTMEHVLDDAVNAGVKTELASLVAAIDDSSETALERSLAACRACVKHIAAPAGMLDEIEAAMVAAGIPAPEDEDRWAKAWSALTDVWASKWNDRAFVSLRNVGIDHDDLRMSVLVQPVVDADYAFVIHTVNPSSKDQTELYAEVVMGLGEALVGNYPGRALSFSVKKTSGETPRVLGFPSKSVMLKIPRQTLIFRSDSNGEDLEGYAGAGLYESVPMDEEETIHADYATDPLVWDEGFRTELLSKIAEAGVAIEAALDGQPQDIEGVVKDGEIYVVQTRPQV